MSLHPASRPRSPFKYLLPRLACFIAATGSATVFEQWACSGQCSDRLLAVATFFFAPVICTFLAWVALCVWPSSQAKRERVGNAANTIQLFLIPELIVGVFALAWFARNIGQSADLIGNLGACVLWGLAGTSLLALVCYGGSGRNAAP